MESFGVTLVRCRKTHQRRRNLQEKVCCSFKLILTLNITVSNQTLPSSQSFIHLITERNTGGDAGTTRVFLLFFTICLK